uniref:Uncharacterized protein n=1 Tax=Arundo donax TaxID=35708 RepID=A0A0A9HF47_ARUDO
MRALLQITMETEDTTERLRAPTVPSWNFSPVSPISTAAPKKQAEQENQKLPGPNHQTTPLNGTSLLPKTEFR